MQRHTGWKDPASFMIGSAISLVLAVTACTEGEAPTAFEPNEMLATQEAQATGQGAVVESGTAVFTFDATVWFGCLGEFVHSTVHAPYNYDVVLMPTGEYVYHDRWITDEVTGTLVGQTSGTVWHRADNVSPLVDRSTGGGMLHFAFKGTFVSDTGPDLFVHEVFHVSRNAAGELTAQFNHATCKVK